MEEYPDDGLIFGLPNGNPRIPSWAKVEPF